MPVFHLIYVSSAVSLFDQEGLVGLLHQSRRNNERLGITGMLLYKDGNFMQMLEGDEQTVRSLYAIIGEDPRHKDVTTVITGETQARSFPDWSMGFRNMNQAGADLPSFKSYVNEQLSLRDFEEDAQHAAGFMRMFDKLTR